MKRFLISVTVMGLTGISSIRAQAGVSEDIEYAPSCPSGWDGPHGIFCFSSNRKDALMYENGRFIRIRLGHSGGGCNAPNFWLRNNGLWVCVDESFR